MKPKKIVKVLAKNDKFTAILTIDDSNVYDRVVFDMSNADIGHYKRSNNFIPILADNEKPVPGAFSPEEIDQLNLLIAGPEKDKITEMIGIHRLRCGVRLYRILHRFYDLKKDCQAKLNKRLISYARRGREICGRSSSPHEKIKAIKKSLQFTDRLRKEKGLPIDPISNGHIHQLARTMINEELLREAISMFDSKPEFLRKLQWSEEDNLFRKSYDYPLYFLILFLGVHLMEKSSKHKCPPYTMIGRFLKEQGIKNYILESGKYEQQRALQSTDVRTKFIKAQKIRGELNRFYEQCRNVYIAPITLPSLRAPNSETPVIEAVIVADQQLRIFVDTPVDDSASFCQLFPPSEEILP